MNAVKKKKTQRWDIKILHEGQDHILAVGKQDLYPTKFSYYLLGLDYNNCPNAEEKC